MGYRGKVEQRAQARQLRAQGWTMTDIATTLGVSRSSVSLWARDVPFTPDPERTPSQRFGARRREPNALQRRKQDEIERLLAEGVQRIGHLSERDFLIAGVALYAGEGSKGDGRVKLTNSDPRFIALFCAWLRHFFEIDERRPRVQLYLHAGLDLSAAVTHWSRVTAIPPEQFTMPYRAVPNVGIRHNKHPHGCATVVYNCSRTHRCIMGLTHALMAARGVTSPA